jgi:hypothetical protein
VIQYFHKSGSTAGMANYRGITLLDTLSKLFNKVITNRLLAHAEDAGLLHEAQNAFRPGRSTDQHICTLSQTVRGRCHAVISALRWQRSSCPVAHLQYRLRQGKATYAFFLDLKKAYDTVWRDGLILLWLLSGPYGDLS